MSGDNDLKKEELTAQERTRIARDIFAAAASMGLSDRQKIEELTNQVIDRLERQRPLPRMEDLVTRPRRRQSRSAIEPDVQAMVKEVLMSAKTTEEVKPMTPTTVPVKTDKQATTGIQLTDNALQVLEKRYLKKDKEGNAIETVEEMFRRVARTIAAAELIYDPQADVKAMEEEFYQSMVGLEFLPNSPTLMNAGRELGQLSACFVLPIEDSMESIFDAVKNTALIHKSGGGTGFSFSRLRPEKDRVGSTGGVASGPVSFMRAFDTATDVIKQGGMRRGANMAILNVDHPDVERFITAKEDAKALNNFNLSVAITAGFMEAVKAGADYDLVNPHSKEVVAKLNAKDVFDKIVALAWKTGDPGIVFIDRINKDNPTPHLGKIESTNPCGEQPLLPYESCNLGSINLSRMLKTANGTAEIDYVKLARVVRLAVRFLDNVIDVNKFPLPQIEQMTKNTRKIGLGIMGFADMLIELGVPYNSEEALQIGSEVMAFISKEARQVSVELGKERGVFPAFKGSVYDVPGGPSVRNATRTTIAPTGTLSIIAGCSSGIEPLFALSYTRNILDGAQLVEVNPAFEQAARNGGFYSEELMQHLAAGVKLHDIDVVPEKIKRIFVTAHDISPEWHVRMQAAFQKSTDNAVSKTVNFPNEATQADVATVYTMAYELGLKGITIYRDGSRETQVLTTGKNDVAGTTNIEKTEVTKLTPRKRPKRTTAFVERVTTGCGNIYITVASDEKGICEVFLALGKSGGCASAQLEAIGRLISITLRAGVDLASIVKQLKGIRCPSIAWEDGKAVLSCADAIASVLEKQLNATEDKPDLKDYGLAKNLGGQCPDCGSLLAYEEGCFKCHACGYTKC
jgi:ribonucleoside-diphosphate reductase alpha chain